MPPVVLMTVVLFALSPLLAPGVLDSGSLLSMAPFAAVLAMVSIGQMLVVRQGGLDLSVPGVISISAAIVTRYPDGEDGRLPVALLLVLGLALAVGLVNGITISVLGVTPLVTTLGVNALLLGGVMHITGGSATRATEALSRFSFGKTFGLPNTVLIAVVVAIAALLVIRKTVVGRRFVVVGANPAAARVAGISLVRYRLGTHVAAALCYAAAGVLLTGFVHTPALNLGDSYLMTSIAAVVVGGTSFTGGHGTVLGTAAGALFLTQLNQVVLSIGATTAIQYLVSGLIIALGMTLRHPSGSWIRRPQPRTNRAVTR